MTFSPKIFLRRFSATILTTTGKFRAKLTQLSDNDNSVILMYHRVLSLENTDEYVEPGMYVTATTFQMHLTLLNHYFNVVPLEEIVSTPKKTSNKKPKCAITFDDGWADFYVNAFPLIKKNSVPVTVFLPTDYIGTTRWFWTDRLADVLKIIPSIRKTEALKTDSVLSRIEELTGTLFDRIDSAIKLLKPYTLEQIHEIIEELENRSAISLDKRHRAFLSWDECRELRASGLVTFGSHTAQHIIMTSETESVCKQDLILSRQKLISEQVVDPAFIPFCYPNGGYSSKIAQLVEKAGYNCAVTTKHGYTSTSGNCYVLNRVGIHQDMTSHKTLMLSRILT